MTENTFNIQGLTHSQVVAARHKHGKNELSYKKQSEFLATLIRIGTDPMMVLLLVASSIYFISGKTGDGIFLSCAIIFQTSISLYQYSRSKNALEKLKDYAKPSAKVIRDSKIIAVKSEELVMGDSIMIEEGTSISADAVIIHSNDFSVNESILTGESFAVFKDKNTENKEVYLGTTVASGLAIAEIIKIGNETKLGKIGKSLERIKEEKTPLEIQIASFVKKMAIIGGCVFLVVWGINYAKSLNILDSLLKALTLAMSILPEEIPVAFTTFMALGAWRLMKQGIVVKQMKTVETLGSATVICTDKTGTLTENKMSLAKMYVFSTKKLVDLTENINEDTKNTNKDTKKLSDLSKKLDEDTKKLIMVSMFASEPIPFDPMEVALHEIYTKTTQKDTRKDYKLVHEYALAGVPPMMTHIFADENGNKIIAAKGAPEALINVTHLSKAEKEEITKTIQSLSSEGLRVLGVAEATFKGTNFPEKQEGFSFKFVGILAFYDPPKKNIQKVLQNFYTAGISVKIITGDNAETTTAIAKQIGFVGYEKHILGEDLIKLDKKDLKKCVMETNLFVRMFPEAKLKIIEALKAQKQIVAMTGDGVNDGPALKAAHIGIAMGIKGTEIAKQAASLILLKDDLSKMVVAISMGRKIYTNLKKAIQYIISIHIPIILVVFIPLALGWAYPNIFSPLHIIFLELIMGPTCSIIYEGEPIEKNTMSAPPKPLTTTFFNWKELSTSIVQGLIITIGALFIYQYAVYLRADEQLTRTMVFTTLIVANIFLTLINRSFYYSIWTTLKYKNPMVLGIILSTIVLAGIILYVPPVTSFFSFEQLGVFQLGICILVGFVSVIWFEIVKWTKRNNASG